MGGKGGSTSSQSPEIPAELKALFSQAAGVAGGVSQAAPWAQYLGSFPTPVSGYADLSTYAMEQIPRLFQQTPEQAAWWGINAEIPELTSMPVQTPRAEMSQYNLLRGLTGGPIGQSPLLQEGVASFVQNSLPLIQNQLAVAGLGRSGSLGPSIATGLSQTLTPLIQQEISNRVGALSVLQQMAQAETSRYLYPREQTVNALQQMSAETMQMATLSFQQQMQAINTALQAGQIQEAKANELAASAQAEFQRLYALAQQSSFGVLGQAVPSMIGSIGKTSQSGTTMEFLGPLLMAAAMYFSSRDFKEDFRPIDPKALALALDDVPVLTWRYRPEFGDPATHIGPTVEDLNEHLGGVGTVGKFVNVLDLVGLSLAVIKDVRQEVKQLQTAVAELRNTASGAGEQERRN